MGWIDSAVQREVGELRVQLYSQKDQILLVSHFNAPLEFISHIEYYISIKHFAMNVVSSVMLVEGLK